MDNVQKVKNCMSCYFPFSFLVFQVDVLQEVSPNNNLHVAHDAIKCHTENTDSHSILKRIKTNTLKFTL
jgi:hypothetical protein